MINQLHSEFEANQELRLIAKQQGTARMDFNLSGNIARQALRRHHVKHSSGVKNTIAKITTFFIGA